MTNNEVEQILVKAFGDLPDGVPMVEIKQATQAILNLINKAVVAELENLIIQTCCSRFNCKVKHQIKREYVDRRLAALKQSGSK